MTLEVTLYLVISLFNLVILDRFLRVFFESKQVKKGTEHIMFTSYFLATTGYFILFDNKYINMVVILLAFYLLSFAYKSEWRNRVYAILVFLVLSLFSDVAVSLALRSVSINATKLIDPTFIVTFASGRLLFFAAVLYIEKLTVFRQGEKLPPELWILMFIIPVGSVMVTIILYYSNITETSIFFSTVFLVFLNVFVFYLYDRQTDAYIREKNQEIFKTQYQAYEKQFELMNDSLQGVRSIKHDIKNHMLTIEALNNQGLKKELSDYVHALTMAIEPKDYVRSGNNTINSILNYKVDVLERHGHEINLNVTIPNDLDINSFDISTIIGNLMDNAIEAVSVFNSKQTVEFEMFYEKGTLFIHTVNPFDPRFELKKNREKRGIGLRNIERVVQKYSGIVTTSKEQNVFKVRVMLYV